MLATNPETGLPELLATKNNTKPPVNDQISFGVRQKFGVFQASLTGSYQRGRNGYTYLFATRNNNGLGGCCDTTTVRANGYSNALIGYDGLDTRYRAIYFTLDKNYTESSGWGFNIAYTLGKGEKNGGDLFSLDALTPDDYGWRPNVGDERHRVVLSGLVDLPWGIKFSTLTTLGSGQAYNVTDSTGGTQPGQQVFKAAYPEKNCIGGVFAYCEVNLTLAKRFKVLNNNDGLELAVDVLNAFNNKNFAGFDEGLNLSATPPDILEAANGENASRLLTLPRRIQFRVGYRF